MTIGITRIDHPVIASADLDRAEGLYRRLGFIVPPRGSHLEWGTGNLCIMFPDDYLELRGIVDASRYTHNLNEFLASRGEGLMGVAFGTEDAAESYRRAQQIGLAPRALKELTRRFHLPEGDAFPKFSIVYLDEGDAPGLLTSVICGHRTPELIRRPEWLDHPNGVTGVTSITAVVADPAALKFAYEKLIGVVSDIDGGIRVDPGRGAVIDFVAPDRAAVTGCAVPGAELPYLPEMSLRVGDLAVTRRVLEGKGVPFKEPAASALLVAADHTCGVAFRFVAARA